MIRFSKVTKSYTRGQPALRDLNLFFGRGELAFLTGPSGSGNSTLLKHI